MNPGPYILVVFRCGHAKRVLFQCCTFTDRELQAAVVTQVNKSTWWKYFCFNFMHMATKVHVTSVTLQAVLPLPCGTQQKDIPFRFKD